MFRFFRDMTLETAVVLGCFVVPFTTFATMAIVGCFVGF